MEGICKLCLKQEKLRHSHILPEFMYQNIYDNDPKRFYTLDIDIAEIEKSKSRIQQKGIREFLLCDQCEGLISKYEDYAAETIYAKRLGNKAYIADSSVTPDFQYFIYDYAGFSYQDFKIFLMSILWRLIISDSFYTPEISPAVTERLRVAILTQDPLEFDEFGCLVQVILYKEGKIAGKFILQPYVTGIKSDIINVLIDGFMFSFYLNSKIINAEQKDVFVKPDGTMKIIGRVIFNDHGLMKQVMAMNNFYLGSTKS